MANQELANQESVGLANGSNYVTNCMLTPSPSINNAPACFNIGVGDDNVRLDNSIKSRHKRGVRERERHHSAAADVGNHQSGFKRKAKEVHT